MSNILMQFAAKTAAAAGGFDVENDITWKHLWWASSSVNSGYSDTDPVGTWYASVGEDVTQGTGNYQPTFVASATNLNNQKALDFDGGNDRYTHTFSAAPSYTSGVTWVMIVDGDATAGVNMHLMTGTSTSTENRTRVADGTQLWQIEAGNGNQDGTTTYATGGHLITSFFDGSTGNDIMILDGTTEISADAGSEQVTGINIAANAAGTGSHWNGRIALIGCYEGRFDLDSEYSNFKTWVGSYYGITVA